MFEAILADSPDGSTAADHTPRLIAEKVIQDKPSLRLTNYTNEQVLSEVHAICSLCQGFFEEIEDVEDRYIVEPRAT